MRPRAEFLELTLYLVERDGGADAGGESRLVLGADDRDRALDELAGAGGVAVTATPLDAHGELDALGEADDPYAILADVYGYAEVLELDVEPGRCDPYALLLAVREAVA